MMTMCSDRNTKQANPKVKTNQFPQKTVFYSTKFSVSFAATAFGKGTYFAVNSSYSANKTYSPLDSKGQQHIIQARVATGDFHIGNQSMVAPPPKHGQSDLYDSLVDNVNNPTIFVIFRDDQAYPEYVISFSL